MLEKGADCTHFSFAFLASGGGLPAELIPRNIELFAKKILPTLKSWSREPTTSRAAD
jgi:hypothetical protein